MLEDDFSGFFFDIPVTTLSLDVLKTHVPSTGLGPLANTTMVRL